MNATLPDRARLGGGDVVQRDAMSRHEQEGCLFPRSAFAERGRRAQLSIERAKPVIVRVEGPSEQLELVIGRAELMIARSKLRRSAVGLVIDGAGSSSARTKS